MLGSETFIATKRPNLIDGLRTYLKIGTNNVVNLLQQKQNISNQNKYYKLFKSTNIKKWSVKLAKDKFFRLLRKFLNYGQKSNIGPSAQCYKNLLPIKGQSLPEWRTSRVRSLPYPQTLDKSVKAGQRQAL